MEQAPKKHRAPGIATVAQLGERFDAYTDIIDTRSPAEFAEDHLPGAINCPALDDAQRAEIGTLYKQVSPFAARRRGAALVAINIGHALLEHFQDRPREWRPLIYCWRGGQRSGAYVTVFRQIGWDAQQLAGGYKAYRHAVVERLAQLPQRFAFRVLAGPTGSAKSRVLEALAAQGAQVLDLETLAAHKGSVLGQLPGAPQPSQKGFETRLLQALTGLDAARPVYAEAESRRIGALSVPTELLEALRCAPCRNIEAGTAARVDFLLRDYDYFTQDPERLVQRLERLRELRGGDTVARWQGLIAAGEWHRLVEALLTGHYDPLYRRSQRGNYSDLERGPTFATDDLSPAGIAALAARILEAESIAT
jgi:tRNA 2-selenouridine synthase